MPTSSKNSFPRSAVEWKASANIAELPVPMAAMYLQTAIARFATIATTTIRWEDRKAIQIGRDCFLEGCTDRGEKEANQSLRV
jgi:hypothetical protein